MLGFALVWQNPKACLKPHSIKLYVNMNGYISLKSKHDNYLGVLIYQGTLCLKGLVLPTIW